MIGDYHHVKADRLVNAEIQMQNRMWGPSYERAESPFHKARAIRLTRIMAAASTKKASAEDGVAS